MTALNPKPCPYDSPFAGPLTPPTDRKPLGPPPSAFESSEKEGVGSF